MTTKLSNDLLAALEESLKELDFTREKKRSQSYLRKYEWGLGAVHTTIIRHDGQFDVKADIALRIHKVEELIGAIEKSPDRKSMTIGIEFGNLLDGRPRRWTIADSSGIETVVEEITRLVETIALPYFENHSQLRNIFALLTANDKNAAKHCPLNGERAKRVIAVAHLLDDESPKSPEALVKSNVAVLKEINDFGLADFESFAKGIIDMRAGSQK